MTATPVPRLSTQPSPSGTDPVVNVAATCAATTALGPGVRAVIWVQGCPFRCAGCLAPDWIPRRDSRLVRAGDLAQEVLADRRVEGLTLSGGEPMMQAGALAAVVTAARRDRDLSVVCFTGFARAELDRLPDRVGTNALLDQIDVLIDGRYVAALDDGQGLRGSSNQHVHHLTDRLSHSGYDFTTRQRSVEIRVSDQEILMVGVPPPGLLTLVDDAIDQHRRTGRKQP